MTAGDGVTPLPVQDRVLIIALIAGILAAADTYSQGDYEHVQRAKRFVRIVESEP